MALFKCWLEDREEIRRCAENGEEYEPYEPRHIEARDAGSAAERYAEALELSVTESEEPYDLDLVCVEPPEGGPVVRLIVTMSLEVRTRARAWAHHAK